MLRLLIDTLKRPLEIIRWYHHNAIHNKYTVQNGNFYRQYLSMFDRFQIIPVLTVSRAKGLSTRSLTDGIGSMACYDTDTHCKWDVDPHNTTM